MEPNFKEVMSTLMEQGDVEAVQSTNGIKGFIL